MASNIRLFNFEEVFRNFSLFSVTVGIWPGKARSPEATDDERRERIVKLVDPKALKDFTTIKTAVYNYIKAKGVPFIFGRGGYLVKTEHLDDIFKFLVVKKDAFFDLVDTFEDVGYALALDESRLLLTSEEMAICPSVESIRSKFNFRYFVASAELSWRNENEKAAYMDSVSNWSVSTGAKLLIKGEELLGNAVLRLQNKDAIFRNTLLTNVTDWADEYDTKKALFSFHTEGIDILITNIKRTLSNIDVLRLRSNEDYRLSVAAETKKFFEQLKGLIPSGEDVIDD